MSKINKSMNAWMAMNSARAVAPCLAIALTILPGLLQAEVILDDDFETAAEIDGDFQIDSKVTWESAQNRKSLSIGMDPEGLNSGKVLGLGSGIVFTRIPVLKLEVGGSLVSSLRFRSLDEKVEFLGPLRIGLCEIKDDELPDSGDTVGYWVVLGPGTDAKSGILVEHNTESQIGGGSDTSNLGDGFVLDFDWTKPHRLTFKIVRPSEDSIEIHTQLDDGPEVVRTEAKASLTQFNLFAIRLSNTPTSRVFIDDVKIELTKK